MFRISAMILEMRIDGHPKRDAAPYPHQESNPDFLIPRHFSANPRINLYHVSPICILPIGSILPFAHNAIVCARQSRWFAANCSRATIMPNN
jgi:hypothetical protein